jgi:hypothetical protein
MWNPRQKRAGHLWAEVASYAENKSQENISG